MEKFWTHIAPWKEASEEEFLDPKWQFKNTITLQLKRNYEDQKAKSDHMRELARKIESYITLPESILNEITGGLLKTPMNIRITPYIFSLIDWEHPFDCPLRKQFIPFESQFLEDHPFFQADSLAEDTDSPVDGITHRYRDKVLFLTTAVCPVYCLYCTRSRVVGGTTDIKEKDTFGANQKRWLKGIEYIRNNSEIKDVVLSGGDVSMLSGKQLDFLINQLLDLPNIKRIRLATKSLAIYPQKYFDEEWYLAIKNGVEKGRSMLKEVVIHTHFSSPKEITEITKLAANKLFKDGITVRNQAVHQEGVNNSTEIMKELHDKISDLNIEPYYVYIHDMVNGCEHLRTTLRESIDMEKHLRGFTAGFKTPLFVCDLPGGGGKRNSASFEYYSEKFGISLWTAPSVKDGYFFYYDPIHKLSIEAQDAWKDLRAIDEIKEQMIKQAELKKSN
jgi:lysine 2,3-aminomutase